MQTNIVHRLLWGGILVAVGIVFLLNQTGVTAISIGDLFRNFWPVILILVGLQGMLIQRSGGYLWNMIVMLVGIVFLGRNLNLIEWDLSDLFSLIGPIVLILFGLGMMTRGSRSRRANHEEDRRSYGWNPVTPPMPGGQVRSEPPQGPPPAPPLSDDPNAPFSAEPGNEQQWEKNRDPRAHAEEQVRERMNRHQERVYERINRHKERVHERMNRHQERWREHQARHDQRRSCGNHSWWSYDPSAMQHHRFIGDVHIGQDYWELQPMNVSHFIGDTTIDLTKAQIPLGETKIYVSCFIGDVKVFVPSDSSIGIQVVSSSLIGDVRVWDQKRGGLFNSMSVETPYYADTDKRVVLVASAFIGDVRVTKVG